MYDFSPNHPIVKLCLLGIIQEEKGDLDAANRIFLQVWKEASNDFEKYLAAFFLARTQQNAASKLPWLEKVLELARGLNPEAVLSVFPVLYADLAQCYEDLKDPSQAQKFHLLAAMAPEQPNDPGPFYHGTKAPLQMGELLTPGGLSNYQSELKMNHIYFTALHKGAGLAAALAKGEGPERVYLVEPIGEYENDPNVTNQKFPGNPTRSYRSLAPLKILGEVHNWEKQTPEELLHWRNELKTQPGKIIN